MFILPVLFVITLVPGMLSVLKDLKLLGGGRWATSGAMESLFHSKSELRSGGQAGGLSYCRDMYFS